MIEELQNIYIDNSGNVMFYMTTDHNLIINIEDISILIPNKVIDSNGKLDYLNSYYTIYMKGNGKSIKIGYRDGIQILNIIQSNNYGLFINSDEVVKTTKENFNYPPNISYNYSYLSQLKYNNMNNNSMNEKWINYFD